ncbi:MAG: triose-phosphate isomerase [Deltaproteobacteria bacterium]|nr:triose-phosphate isomerase [Deltaproteobacteria bacterium]
MRPPLIVANWKMNHTVSESLKFATVLGKQALSKEVEIVICPPFSSLQSLSIALHDMGGIKLGAQNCHWEESGAYTGEVSAVFLKELECAYVLVGHSERRHLFGESDETINKKLIAVLSQNLSPIFCIGETEQERKENKTTSVIKKQLEEGLKTIRRDEMGRMVIAYEPVWAIGTGQNATPEQAEEVHTLIRSWISKAYSEETAAALRILYGGSVKGDNITSLMKKPNIDGALVGGASLAVDSFLKIINYGAANEPS